MMNSSDKPPSIKDRIAKFENLINNQSGPSPAAKNNNPSKPSPPQVAPTPIVSPPTVVKQNNGQGQVDTGSIVKPSVVRQTWQNNTINTQNEVPKNKVEIPSTKPHNDKPPQLVSVPRPTEQNVADDDKVLSPTMIKQMLEGKVQNMNRQSYPVQPRSIIPKEEQRQIKEAPVVITEVQGGSVKGNINSLNHFFETQNQNAKIKNEEDTRLKLEVISIEQSKPESNSPEIKREINQGNTQNTAGTTPFFTPPGLNQSPPRTVAEPQQSSPSPVQGQDQNMLARIKKKKRTKERFDSEEED